MTSKYNTSLLEQELNTVIKLTATRNMSEGCISNHLCKVKGIVPYYYYIIYYIIINIIVILRAGGDDCYVNCLHIVMALSIIMYYH